MKCKKKATVVAVQINLELPLGAIEYIKWGGTQVAKQGDWLILSNGDVYTCDQKVFADTYEQVGPGEYRKTTLIDVERAQEDGSVETLEGIAHYKKGDYVVSNIGGDKYFIAQADFEDLYDVVEGDYEDDDSPMVRYQKWRKKMKTISDEHRDEILDVMDGLWWEMSDEEREQINGEPPMAEIKLNSRTAIMAPGLLAEELKELREQIEKSRRDPNYVIVTNYQFHVRYIELPEASDED